MLLWRSISPCRDKEKRNTWFNVALLTVRGALLAEMALALRFINFVIIYSDKQEAD
jgi:hypothetical protein